MPIVTRRQSNQPQSNYEWRKIKKRFQQRFKLISDLTNNQRKLLRSQGAVSSGAQGFLVIYGNLDQRFKNLYLGDASSSEFVFFKGAYSWNSTLDWTWMILSFILKHLKRVNHLKMESMFLSQKFPDFLENRYLSTEMMFFRDGLFHSS